MKIPAHDNPWYWLATVWGEREGISRGYDNDLAAKNREIWNRFWAAQLSPQDREQLIESGVSPSDRKPFSEEEIVLLIEKSSNFKKFYTAWKIHKKTNSLEINFRHITFDKKQDNNQCTDC